MSGYYVRRQGDDSDYLEHAFTSGAGSGGRSHKYLAKIPIAGGAFRYIYDQASLLAARAGNAVSNVRREASRAIGLTTRNQMNRAADRMASLHNQKGRRLGAATRAHQALKAAYGKTLLGRAENAANAARNAIGNAVGEARRRGEGVIGSIKKGAYAVGGQVAKATGLEARGRMNRLGAQRQRMLKGSGKGLHGVNKAYNAAKSSYNKSILGRAENAFNAARGAVSGAVGGARNAASNAVDKARTKGQSAIDAAVGAGRGAANKVREATGLEARGRMNRLGAQRQRILKGNGSRGLNAVNQAYNSAKDSYNRSLAGRAENAFNAARGAVSGAAGKARSKGREAVNNARTGVREGLRSTGMNRGERRNTERELNRATTERDRLERGIEAARVKNGEFYDPNDKLEIARERARRRAQAKVNSATTVYNNARSKGKRRRT